MDTTTFIITVFCLIDDWLKDRSVRQRGPAPTVTDSEVLTMEVVGEFLGIDTDQGLFTFFRREYGAWFPALKRINRTTFARQAANLWKVKHDLWQSLTRQILTEPRLSIVDSLPVPACRFGRAKRCHILSGATAYGYDEVAHQIFFGLRAHARIAWPGVIVALSLAPANQADTEVVPEVLRGVRGWVLGDRNYWDPELFQQLRQQGIFLLAPFKSAKRQKFRWPLRFSHMRYRIDTVFGQLVDRFHAKRTWARDAWHLTSRWLRKILSHTVAAWCCQQVGLPLLHFADLLSD
jgi:hypothetical protein